MSVFTMVSAVAGFVKVRYLNEKANIDNAVFRCHYRITTAILFVSCILVTANNLIGKCKTIYYWNTNFVHHAQEEISTPLWCDWCFK